MEDDYSEISELVEDLLHNIDINYLTCFEIYAIKKVKKVVIALNYDKTYRIIFTWPSVLIAINWTISMTDELIKKKSN